MPKFRNWLKRSLNNPAVPLSAAGFFAWAFGGEPTAAGELVTAESALHLIPVIACIRTLADGVASLPLKIYKQSPTGKQILTAHPVAKLLSIAPNDEMTVYSLIWAMIAAMMSNGNCYLEIQRSGKLPIGLWSLHPALTEPNRDTSGNLYYTTTDTPDKRTRTIAAEDMIHVPYLSMNGVKGLSPIGLAKQSIGLTIAAEKFGARFFGNNATPGGILSNKAADTMSEEQRQLLRESWDQAHSGSNQHRTAILNGDWAYTAISISPEDSQFLQIREFQRTEIAALYNVPPSKIGDQTKQSKASAEQENLSFVTDTLRPLCVRLEQEFHRKLFPDQQDIVIEFDFSERLRGDFQTTMAGLAIGRQWGIFSENDCLKILDRDPSPDPAANIKWAPVNMQNAAWMVETESIQDQPVGAQPEQKSFLQQIEGRYALLFRDAMGRAMQRPVESRTADTIRLIFEPVVRSLASATEAEEKHVTAALSSLAHRSAKWTPESAGEEFRRVIRSLRINAQRDKAAKFAEREMASPEVSHAEEN